MRASTSRTAAVLQGLIVPVIAVLGWQSLSYFSLINPQIVPSPWAVLVKWAQYLAPTQAYSADQGNYLLWLLSGELPHDVWASGTRVIGGFFIGAVLALPLGLVMGVNKTVYKLCDPLLQILRPIPPIAYIPLAILWFGLGNPPAFFLISIGSFFPVLMNTIAGVQNVDGIYLRAARNLGAGQMTLFRHVILPAAAPYILTGARIGMGTAFIVVIVAEMIAVTNGLGYRILEAREYFWSDKIIAGMFTIGLFGLAIDTAMNALNRHLLKWHRGLDQ